MLLKWQTSSTRLVNVSWERFEIRGKGTCKTPARFGNSRWTGHGSPRPFTHTAAPTQSFPDEQPDAEHIFSAVISPGSVTKPTDATGTTTGRWWARDKRTGLATLWGRDCASQPKIKYRVQVIPSFPVGRWP